MGAGFGPTSSTVGLELDPGVNYGNGAGRWNAAARHHELNYAEALAVAAVSLIARQAEGRVEEEQTAERQDAEQGSSYDRAWPAEPGSTDRVAG